MARRSHTLTFIPSTAHFESCSPSQPLSRSDALAVHRTLGPDLALRTAHVEVGAELLPNDERPRHGTSVKLLWVPVLPSRCLLAADDPRGVLRIVARDRSGPSALELARTLERLEVACAFALDGALVEPPNVQEVRDYLDVALEQSLLAILLFADQAAPEPFWKRSHAS